MAKVVLKELVVNMVVSGGTQADLSEQSLPGKGYLGVYQREPVRVGRPKCHVSPYVAASDYVGGDKERQQYHDCCVWHAPVERVEELGVCESEFSVRQG